MKWEEYVDAVEIAKTTVRRGDQAIKQLAELMRNRLRIAKVGGHILADLKRELRDFNMQTHKWKDK